MKKKYIRVVVILIVLTILGWIIAYSISPTLQRKYDARSYGNFLLKQEKEQLKKDYPIDKIKYSWSLWATPQGKLNDAWGAYPPDNAFACSIHIYQLEKPIPYFSNQILQSKNFYSSLPKKKSHLSSHNNYTTEFRSQWYSLPEFNIDYFKPYLDTRYAPFHGKFKACIESFLNKNKSQREPVVIPNSVLNKVSENSLYGKYYYGYQDYPFISFLKNRSDYLNILFSSTAKIKFEGKCYASGYTNTTKFYIYDEKKLNFSIIQIRTVLNFKDCPF